MIREDINKFWDRIMFYVNKHIPHRDSDINTSSSDLNTNFLEFPLRNRKG